MPKVQASFVATLERIAPNMPRRKSKKGAVAE
jgi:hypothetical protein